MSEHLSVEQLILERKRQQRLQTRRKWVVRGLFVSWILALGLAGAGYLTSALSQSRRLVWSGDYLLSPNELRELSELDSIMWSSLIDPVELSDRLLQHPLIASATIQRDSGNSFTINLSERRLVGLILSAEGHKFLVENGTLVAVTSALVNKNLSLPLIYDFENAEDLVHLATALSALDDEIFVNISEIHINETAFEQPILTLHMQEGNRVYVAISALFRLSDYLRVIQNTGLTNACFELIETGDAVPVISCPQD